MSAQVSEKPSLAMAARRRPGHLLAVLGALALGAATVVPAVATARGAISLRIARPAGKFHISSTTNPANQAFAGYRVGQTGATSVVAQFRRPALTCTNADTGIGPGAFTLSGPSDHQQFSFAGIIMGCTGGTIDPSHEALVVNGAETDYGKPVYLGDQLMVQLTINAKATVAQVSDLTRGHAFVISATGRGEPARLELVGEYAVQDVSSGAQLQVPNFGTLNFSSASVGGSPIGSESPVAYDMETSGKVVQISTGALTATNDGFPSVFKHG